MDFDELYWFLCHEGVVVYIEGRKWYLMFEVPCRYLDERARCRIYSRRPYVCRSYSVDSCEYQGEVEFQAYMRTPEDLKRYMRKRGLRLRMAWDDPEPPQGRRVKKGRPRR